MRGRDVDLIDLRRAQYQLNLDGGRALTTSFGDLSYITPKTQLSDLRLSWAERELPERERTKHVHRLHPYLGKFIPQLVEVFLRKFEPGIVCDPFCGSGTTLVEANALGFASVGMDISEFNCLLSRVKTAHYNVTKLERELKDILARTIFEAKTSKKQPQTKSEYLSKWFSQKVLRELLIYRSLLNDYEHADVMKVILSRAARSSRLTTHFDLDFPKKPQTEPYYCYKHRRTCQPTTDALKFLSRYTVDTVDRITEFAKLQTNAPVEVICGDSRRAQLPEIDAVITSPPYLGLIDYHEQHRYAYELLGLSDNEEHEIGAAKKGKSMRAQQQYLAGICDVFKNVRKTLSPDGVVVIVVHDDSRLYEQLALKAGYHVDYKLARNVDRRTGRRSTDFFEDILIWRPNND